MVETSEVEFVPAAPGFEALEYLPDTKSYEARPVIAWAVLRSEDAVRAWPVAIGEAWSLNDDRAVCLPTGQVICADREWETIVAWLDHMIKSENVTINTPQRDAPVLALDAFRGKFRSEA